MQQALLPQSNSREAAVRGIGWTAQLCFHATRGAASPLLPRLYPVVSRPLLHFPQDFNLSRILEDTTQGSSMAAMNPVSAQMHWFEALGGGCGARELLQSRHTGVVC